MTIYVYYFVFWVEILRVDVLRFGPDLRADLKYFNFRMVYSVVPM